MARFRDRQWRKILVAVRLATMAALCAVAGCRDDGRVAVSGTALHSGRPVPGLYIGFAGEGPSSPAAWALTDSAGRFQVWGSGKATGLAPGTYRVWIDFRSPEPDPATSGEPQVDRRGASRYRRETSPLTVVIDQPRDDLQLIFD